MISKFFCNQLQNECLPLHLFYSFFPQGRDLLQVLDSSSLDLIADDQPSPRTRVSVLMDDVRDGYLELEDVAEFRRRQLEQFRDLKQFELEAEQVQDIL